MGEHEISPEFNHTRLRAFTHALLQDLRALEEMLAAGLLESGVRRVGAEQEMFLVHPDMQPAPVAANVIASLGDRRFVTELGKFNLEANVTPLEFNGRCLRVMEAELQEMHGQAAKAAAS